MPSSYPNTSASGVPIAPYQPLPPPVYFPMPPLSSLGITNPALPPMPVTSGQQQQAYQPGIYQPPPPNAFPPPPLAAGVVHPGSSRPTHYWMPPPATQKPVSVAPPFVGQHYNAGVTNAVISTRAKVAMITMGIIMLLILFC
uniref:Uncharacterized protein n=1 Tax=Romanomermis culicivorax TaxID=13658 RepID=A0A915L5F2_ROMCU